ncbi:MAG TPA: hypothetical protein VEB21_04275, partial [Terriglobales bacterium]|nr:hypothetical protein [Terriglobales bacterium]
RQERLAQSASQRAHEVLALAVLAEVAGRFQSRAPCLEREQLSEQLRASSHLVNHTINRLVRCGFLREVTETSEIVPAVALESTPVADVITQLRCEGTSTVLGEQVEGLSLIERLWNENESSAWNVQSGLTVGELARRIDSAP